jgi:DNA polymerase (family X)
MRENQKLAEIFSEISSYLAIQEIPFKPQAYQRAAEALEVFSDNVQSIYRQEGLAGLEKIPGVGKSLAEKIKEYLETGRIEYYENLKKKLPVNIHQLTQVEGIGPKTVEELYRLLKIKNLEDLEKAAQAGKIRSLPGFGLQSEKNILKSITIFREEHRRFPLGEILPLAKEIEAKLNRLKEVEKTSLAGSIRRREETIGDVDILVASRSPKKVMEVFTSLPSIVKVWGKGPTKSSIRLKAGFDVDLRLVKSESWGAALQYFTGSKQHNIVLRQLAIKKGLKLNEYGVFKGEKCLAGRTEKDFYRQLGLDWIAPELRNNQGEIEAALKKKLPNLISYQSLKGDLHSASNWGEGKADLVEMIKEAKKLGYHYLAITDRLSANSQASFKRKLGQQLEAIDRLNQKEKNFRLLKGVELIIDRRGNLNFQDDILKQLDWIVVSVQSFFQLSRPEMTKRLLRALEFPGVNLLAHPTNRKLGEREINDLDWEKLFKIVRKNHILLEINSQPSRLDLPADFIREAKKEGVKMVITSGANQSSELRWIEFGLAQARRGWAEKKDILNTGEWSSLSHYLETYEN